MKGRQSVFSLFSGPPDFPVSSPLHFHQTEESRFSLISKYLFMNYSLLTILSAGQEICSLLRKFRSHVHYSLLLVPIPLRVINSHAHTLNFKVCSVSFPHFSSSCFEIRFCKNLMFLYPITFLAKNVTRNCVIHEQCFLMYWNILPVFSDLKCTQKSSVL